MAKTPDYDASKLAAAELADFAQRKGADTQSVLIELAVEEPPVKFTDRASDGDPRRPWLAEPLDEDAVMAKMDALQQELARLVGPKFVRLDIAQAFVVNVTPEQLRAVTRLHDVGCVRPNRTHQIGEGGD
jgi:hypothetical protein